jgi:Zn-dependent protease with chaperone function
MVTEISNLGAPDDTLVAVVLGALLATAGGFIAARFEAWLRRRERERDAALLLGEIVFTFVVILKLADEARRIGDPFGAITMRLLTGARREADAYERNRERLPDLGDAALRIGTHKLMVTLTMSLDGILDSTRQIEALPATKAGQARAVQIMAARDSSFDFIMQTIPSLDPRLAHLSRIARISFDDHEAVVRG